MRKTKLIVSIAALGFAASLLATMAPAAGAATSAPAPVTTNGSTPKYLPPTTETESDWSYLNYLYNEEIPVGCIGIAAGGNAGLYPCTYKNDQSWNYSGNTISVGGYTYYQLQNQEGQCLGVDGGGTKDNTPIVGYTCEPGSHHDQYWAFLNEQCGGFFPLINADGVVVGVKDGAIKAGQPLVAYSYQGLCNNQFWLTGPL